MKPLIQLVLVITASLLLSCTKNDESTIVLIGTEKYIPEISSIIPSQLIQNVGTIYRGTYPPDIEGEYLASPYILTKSTVSYDIVGEVRDDRFIKFDHQHNGICTYDSKQSTEIAHCDTVYIMGDGSNFTVYFLENRTDATNNTKSKTAVVMTGQVSGSGISNFKYGWMLLETNDPNTVPVNSIRVFTDKDNLASRSNWYN